ncbi:MAG: lipoyl(octanoyl) transferase LipB [Akkermansiaceae bacterium]
MQEVPSLEYQWLGQDVDYERGLKIQQAYVEEVLEGTRENVFLALEHASVYTIGRTRDRSSLGVDTITLPHPVIEISRGGQATYHGRGQLTGYPIIDLKPLGKDLHAYIRALEEVLIITCSDYGVKAARRDGMTGVWVENRKLASIGVGVRKWIALHGFAINITEESLSGFSSITPCGLDGVSMTSLESELGKKLSVQAFAENCSTHLQSVLSKLGAS